MISQERAPFGTEFYTSRAFGFRALCVTRCAGIMVAGVIKRGWVIEHPRGEQGGDAA